MFRGKILAKNHLEAEKIAEECEKEGLVMDREIN